MASSKTPAGHHPNKSGSVVLTEEEKELLLLSKMLTSGANQQPDKLRAPGAEDSSGTGGPGHISPNESMIGMNLRRR